MTHREFLEQLAEQGRVNEIIDKCLDLQKDIEALELEKMKAECSLHAELNEQEKLRSRCNECSHKKVDENYSKMTDYDRLIDFLKKAGIEYDTDTYIYQSESGVTGVLKRLIQFGKLDFSYIYEDWRKYEEVHEIHNLICEFDANNKFVKMYNKEED
ncbi:MAG: hypothetical protein U0K91_02365 [Acutalibacteraceae bacterium]|nr:hypothetical protein [Acutalibacteraceae bacterium]